MGISSNNQANIAFKNLLGKSNTDTNASIGGEEYGIFFNISSSDVWTSVIPFDNPTLAVSNNTAVLVVADLSLEGASNDHGYLTLWPSTPPSGIDPKTGTNYVYGAGSLTGISSGDRITGIISESYGPKYQCKVFANTDRVFPTDGRNWIYQYNSGIFWQEDTSGTIPTTIEIYYYIGDNLANTTFGGATGATGPMGATGATH
jgi:hypothetical protein